MLVDANLLIYAVDASSPFHAPAALWWEGALNGPRRVALPWQTIGAFLRITTHPRISETPLSADEAWQYIEEWLASGPVWVPPATERTAGAYRALAAQVPIVGNLVTDAQLAALAVEHGLVVHSADADFSRFPGVAWFNPLRP